MLPPIDESVLQSNPKFAALYATLANNILNPSGSTKKQAGQKERDVVSDVFITTSLICIPHLHLHSRHSKPPV